MSQRTGGIRRPLENARTYSLVQWAIGGKKGRRAYVHEYLKPVAGQRILDLGCGPGDILRWLPAVDYLGVDSNPAYVASGRKHFGARGRFRCADIRNLTFESNEQFDVVISIGLLHHLDDDAAHRVAALAATVLKPRGYLVTQDSVVAEGQARISRWLIGMDRGQSVRDADGYRAILERHFGRVDLDIRHDLARMPYTHAILVARQPSPSATL